MKERLYKILSLMPLFLITPVILASIIILLNGRGITLFKDIQIWGYHLSSFTIFVIMLFWVYIVAPVIALGTMISLLIIYKEKKGKVIYISYTLLILLMLPGLNVLLDLISLLIRNRL